MVTLKEKAALAKEIGALGALEILQDRITVGEMTSLNFKKFNSREASRFLRKIYFGLDVNPTILLSPLFMLMTASIIPLGMYSVLFLIAALSLFTNFIHVTKMDVKYLEYWEEELPYGVMLATKEAMDKGFKEFKIYYPIKGNSNRLIGDPIITGIKNKVEFEIFRWDDFKVY